MPRKTQRRTRRMPRMQGGAWYNALWDGIKKVGGFVKDNKLISKGLGLVNPTWGKAADMVGLGRKPRHGARKPRMRGGAIQI